MDRFWEKYIQSRPAPGSSKGAFDAFAAAHKEPRITAQEPRIGLKPGGIVEPGVKYYGKKVTAGQPVGGASEDFRTFLRGLDKKTLKGSKLADLISKSKVDIKNTLASNVLAEEEFLKIRPKRTLSKEDKVVLEKLLKNKTGRIESVKYKGIDYYRGTDGRIKTKFNIKADRPEAYKKVLSTLREKRSLIESKNVFPAPGDDLKKAIWRDLYGSTKKRTFTQQAGGYKVPEPRLKVISRPDNLTVSSVEDIVLLDTKTKKKINYKNLEKYVDSLPNTSYKELELPYKYKNWLTDQTITYKGKTNISLRTVLRENLLTEGQLKNWKNSPYQIHHPFGINENPFKTQLSMHKANGQEGWIRLDTLKKLDVAGTDEKQIKKVMNSFKKKIEALPGSIQSGVGDELIGKSLAPDEFMKTLFSEAKIGRETRPLVKAFKTFLQEFCGYAGGGRVSFQGGSCSPEVAARNFARASEDLVQGRVTGEAGQKLAEKIGRVSGKVPKSLLTKVLGPYGIGIDVIFEATTIGTDVLQGKPFNEALADNWIIGTPYKKFTGKTGQKLFNERLAKLDSSTKLYGNAMNLGADIEDLEKALAWAEKDIGTARSRLTKEDIAKTKAEIAKKLKEFNTLTKDGTLIEPGTAAYESYHSSASELQDARRAKSKWSKLGAFDETAMMEAGAKRLGREYDPTKMTLYEKRKLKEAQAKPVDLPTKENLNRLFQLYGVVHPRFGQVPEEPLDLMIKQEKWRQLMEQPGIRGTQERFFAGGGLANLTTTVAPGSGPVSQGPKGLASLKKYGNY